MGIDVQIKRNCSYIIVDENADIIDSGWTDGTSHTKTATNLYKIAQAFMVDQVAGRSFIY